MNVEYSILINKLIDLESKNNVTRKNDPVGVGIVDSGIYPHMDLKKKIIHFYDCINIKNEPYDDNGHGTHIAGIIGGNGAASSSRYRGVNPDANLIIIKGLDNKGGGNVSQVVKGIEYLIENRKKYNIKVINISMGGTEEEYVKYNPLLKIVEDAWNSGITVCVAAGNSGPLKGSITIPGTSKKVITIGASDDNIPIKSFGTKKVLVNYSGKGPTKECIVKPDILCPGTNIISCKNNYSGYTSKSGTSMSTAVITGLVSLMISKNPDMTPKDIKKCIKSSYPVLQIENLLEYL